MALTSLIVWGVAIIVFIVVLQAVSKHLEEKTFIRIIVLTSLCYGILIATFVRLIFGDILEDPAYFPDAYHYLTYATAKVLEWHSEGALGYIPLNTRGYTYFVALIYTIFGQNICAVIFVQLLLASLIPLLVFSIAREFFSTKTAKLSALLVAFFPDFYVWASFTLKEIIAVFSISLAVCQFLRFRKHPSLVGFLGVMGPLAFLLFVRAHVAFFLGLIFMLALMWPLTIKRLIWLPIGTAVFMMFISQAGLSNFLTMVFETPLYVYSRGEILVTGTLPEILKMVISGQLLPNLFLGIGRYLLSPLPWQATNAYQAVIPGIVLWYFFLPAVIWGAIGAIRTRKHVYILLFIVLFLVFWYGLILTGTDPRWRLMIVPFICILGAYGFQLLLKSLSGVIIWISGVLAIWLFLLVSELGIKFVLWMLVTAAVIGVLVGLGILSKRLTGGEKWTY